MAGYSRAHNGKAAARKFKLSGKAAVALPLLALPLCGIAQFADITVRAAP